MPRLARVVFENVPHHVTQRGNRRQKVFFATDDYHQDLDWLHHYWSSAPAHCGLKNDKVLSKQIKWQSRCNQIHDWSDWLSGGDNRGEIAVLPVPIF
jgi:hypothetical protein